MLRLTTQSDGAAVTSWNKLNEWTFGDRCCVQGHQITFSGAIPGAGLFRLIHCRLLGNTEKPQNH